MSDFIRRRIAKLEARVGKLVRDGTLWPPPLRPAHLVLAARSK